MKKMLNRERATSKLPKNVLQMGYHQAVREISNRETEISTQSQF